MLTYARLYLPSRHHLNDSVDEHLGAEQFRPRYQVQIENAGTPLHHCHSLLSTRNETYIFFVKLNVEKYFN
jgi:hypothetical protein